MVTASRMRATIWSGCLLAVLLAGTASGLDSPQNPPTPSDADERVKSALGAGSFPWYDSRLDRVKPIKLLDDPQPSPRISDFRWAWGDYVVFGGFVAGFLVLVALMVRYWKRFEPTSEVGVEAALVPSAILGGEVLPSGLKRDGSDPWAEANRRRLSGDFAGAILCLFAHQLLTLSRLGLVRLAPGRTGRQLHRAVADTEFRMLLTPTLRQFEAIYYGHRTPSASDFATVWNSAEEFERRAAQGVAG